MTLAPILKGLPTPSDQSVLVVPLGGTQLVGRNSTLVGHAGRWILIDAGATFAGADDDGASDYAASHGGVLKQIISDYRAIAELGPRLSGIVLTHSHEDHVGALQPLYAFQSLWPGLAKVPIYATAYTNGIVRRKLEEVAGRPKLVEIAPWQSTRVGPFDIVPIHVTHSAPETCALAIRTALGTIVFGSDFKLDPEPVLGRQTDVRTLEIFGAAGVMAFFGDSTNARHAGRSVSEGEAMRGVAAVMKRHPGRVVVSSFASNLARIVGVARAARASGRVLAGAGRSLLANVDLGHEIGILEPGLVKFADTLRLRAADARQTAIVCTGTQAESGAMLQRLAGDLAQGRRGRLCVEPGDMIVHSARVIPGNEASVEALFRTFREHGVEVMTADAPGERIHASGHAKRDELEDVYRMLRPGLAVPVHGDRELIAAHADLAASSGARVVETPLDGEILSVRPGSAQVIGRIRVGQLATIGLGGAYAEKTKLVAWQGGKSPDLVHDARASQSRRPAQTQHRPYHRRPERVQDGAQAHAMA